MDAWVGMCGVDEEEMVLVIGSKDMAYFVMIFMPTMECLGKLCETMKMPWHGFEL